MTDASGPEDAWAGADVQVMSARGGRTQARDMARACLPPIAGTMLIVVIALVALAAILAHLGRPAVWPMLGGGLVAVAVVFLVTLGTLKDMAPEWLPKRRVLTAEARVQQALKEVESLRRASDDGARKAEAFRRERDRAVAAAERETRIRAESAERIGAILGRLANETKEIARDLQYRGGHGRIKMYVGAVGEALGALDNVVGGVLGPEGDAKEETAESLSLTPILRSLVELLEDEAEKRHVRLVSEFDEVPRVLAPPGVARRTMLALIDNAVRHAGEGARIRVSLERDESGGVALHVEDDGVGIPPAVLHQALNPPPEKEGETVATAPAGGLPRAIRAAAHIGAQLSVESKPEKGTVARIVFPLA